MAEVVCLFVTDEAVAVSCAATESDFDLSAQAASAQTRASDTQRRRPGSGGVVMDELGMRVSADRLKGSSIVRR